MKTTLMLLMASCLVESCPVGHADWIPVRISGMLYPVLANQARIAGSVTLRVRLGDDGSVIGASPIDGNRILAEAAAKNIRLWRFKPACEKEATPLGAVLEFKYVFKLQGEVDYRPRSDFAYEHPYVVTITSQAQLWTPQSP